MEKLSVFWVNSPDEDDPDDTDHYIGFRLRDEWVAVDDQQLILPISLTERDGETLDESVPGLLKQYGGEGLLTDMLLSDGDIEAGSEWLLSHDVLTGRTIEPIPE